MKTTEPAVIRTFEDLECWKQCRILRLFVARQVVPALPRDERYRLGDQLLRAARATTANIAEGYGRFHYLDNAKFCSNARGSCWEVLDHLITGNDESLMPRPPWSRKRARGSRREAIEWIYELFETGAKKLPRQRINN